MPSPSATTFHPPMRPEGSGRLAVRGMSASRSRSRKWFSAPAPPAAITVTTKRSAERRRRQPAGAVPT